MSVEANSKRALPEYVVESGRYSRDGKLDQFLKKLDGKLGDIPEGGKSAYEMVELLGFRSAEVHTLTLRFLQQAQMQHFFRAETTEQIPRLRYSREQILVASAAVQIRLQGVIWDNLPYVVYHYLVDPKVRAVINKPTVQYNSEREWGHATSLRNRILKHLDNEVVFPEPESLDLSAETILSNFPPELLPDPWEKVVKKSVKDNIVPRGDVPLQLQPVTLTLERLEELYTLLTQAAPGKFPQMDSISAVRFSGFNIKEIEAVFDEYDNLRGEPPKTFADEYKTYYALGQVLGKILRARESIRNRR